MIDPRLTNEIRILRQELTEIKRDLQKLLPLLTLELKRTNTTLQPIAQYFHAKYNQEELYKYEED